jgi:hypothetical protein
VIRGFRSKPNVLQPKLLAASIIEFHGTVENTFEHDRDSTAPHLRKFLYDTQTHAVQRTELTHEKHFSIVSLFVPVIVPFEALRLASLRLWQL